MDAVAELDRIEALPKSMLAPKDVCKYLGLTSYSINLAVMDGKNPFPFPVIYVNRQVHIPKLAFVKVMRGEGL